VRPSLIIASSIQGVPETLAEKIPVVEFHSPQWRKFLKSERMTPVDRLPSDVAVMMMTSGSSFQPRPAMLTHGSLMANLEQAAAMDDLHLSNDDVVLAALPMYHIFGLHVVVGFSLYSRSLVVIARTFDAIELSGIIHHDGVTVVPGVPALFDAFARNPNVTVDALTNVRLFISGGAPMRWEVRERFHERFGRDVAEGYGLTEASPMVSFTAQPKKEGDLGTTLQGIEIDVRDSSGAASIEGDAGQIVVKGPNVFAGYYRDRDATSRVLDPNGWLFTGDIGVRDEDGAITLIDRTNDVIVVNGFSVFPSEVEKVLLDHEQVDSVSVVGELNAESGEVPIAYVVLVGNESGDDPRTKRTVDKVLREHCTARLARYKIPTRFEIVDGLSLRASGRPLRKSLRSALKNIDG
jgi:long-chain acyl-CoA synthetase